MRLDVGRRKDAGDTFSTSAARYWGVIDDLTRIVDGGDPSIGLPPYNGGLFNAARTPLLTRIRLSDAVMADAIDALSFERTGGLRRYINYRDLSVQQLGSIYERLAGVRAGRDEETTTAPRPSTCGPTPSPARGRAATTRPTTSSG